MSEEDYLGYAILRGVESENVLQIWESVIRHDPIINNYLHTLNIYDGYVGSEANGKPFRVRGSYYAQQNNLTSVCAHVALQTLLNDGLYERGKDIIRAEDMNVALGINHTTNKLGRHGRDEYGTLSTGQVLTLLRKKYNLEVHRYTFAPTKQLDYAAFLYPYIESCCGCLLAFGRPVRDGGTVDHVVPVIGHTFNSDLWFPEAGLAYLNVPDEPNIVLDSRQWVDHFLIHDDNYGIYMCLPAHCLDSESHYCEGRPRGGTRATDPASRRPSLARHAFAVVPSDVQTYPQTARRYAARVLYDLKKRITDPRPMWLKEVLMAVNQAQPEEEKGHHALTRAPVMRTLLVSKQQLLAHWDNIGAFNKLDGQKQQVEREIAPYVWLVEVSISEVFTANRAKVVDIAMNAVGHFSESASPWRVCCAIRVPGEFILPNCSGGEKRLATEEPRGYADVFRHARTPVTLER